MMNQLNKLLKALFFIPAALLAIYIAFLWITYIDKTVVSGSMYGFTIGDKKNEVYEQILGQQEEYPYLHFYVRTGDRSRDFIEAHVSSVPFEKIEMFERWGIQFDGQHEYFNVLKLKFDEDNLVEIHRHRKYFELP